MNAYIVRTSTGIIAVRTTAETRISEMVFLAHGVPCGIALLSPEVATAMQIPEKEGVYPDAVWEWIKSPANLLGETLRKGPAG